MTDSVATITAALDSGVELLAYTRTSVDGENFAVAYRRGSRVFVARIAEGVSVDGSAELLGDAGEVPKRGVIGALDRLAGR